MTSEPRLSAEVDSHAKRAGSRKLSGPGCRLGPIESEFALPKHLNIYKNSRPDVSDDYLFGLRRVKLFPVTLSPLKP